MPGLLLNICMCILLLFPMHSLQKLFMCMDVHVAMYVCVPVGPDECLGSAVGGVTGNCKLPSLDAEN